MAGQLEAESVRVAELVATLSYAADLGLGQPLAHCMRQMVLSLRIADLAGASRRELEATYYLAASMMNVYCHADAAEQARWFGDDITFKGDAFELLDMNTAQSVAFIVRRVGSHGSRTARARRLAAFAVAGHRQVVSFLTTHSTLGAAFAEQIGLGDEVCNAIRQGYEQWDGKGYPNHLRGNGIVLPARIVQLASPIEIYSRRRGSDAAQAVARRRSGTQFDPDVVDLFCANAPAVLDGLDDAADWDAVIDAEPTLSRRVAGAELDGVLEAMADLVDMKSPSLAGHSRGVANLARAAGQTAGLTHGEASILYRAGLVHDLGRLGVSNAVWDKPGPLTDAEFERSSAPPLSHRAHAGPGEPRSGEASMRSARLCDTTERLDGSGPTREG